MRLRFAGLPFALAAVAVLVGARLARAQAGAATPAGNGEIAGRLVDSASGRPIAVGSITVRASRDSAFAGGALPNADGSFRVRGLAPGRYAVRFRAIGFRPLVRAVAITPEQAVVDLGTLAVTQVPVELEAQRVTVERPDVALAPDRNSYSTKNMATASGGTAIDVLRNVPSVEVDASNKVSLRGNENVVVQINGRPSPLHGEQLGAFLAQLPSSAVSRVEVATNPSAKDDPEGTAGIINIVLEQQADAGLSGGVTTGTGTTGMANVGGNLGRQSGPWTLFASYNLFSDQRSMTGSSTRANIGPSPTYETGRLEGTQRPFFQNATFRSEYRFTERDALSADAVLSGGRFGGDNTSHYVELDSAATVTSRFDLFNGSRTRVATQDYALAFRHGNATDAKATTFSSELRYVRNAFDTDNRLASEILQGNGAAGSAQPAERDRATSRLPSLTLQMDYAHPFGEGTKLEAGVKGTQRSTANDFAAAYRDSASGEYVPAPERASSFDYLERIGAGYAVLSQRLGAKVTGQLGMRLEQATTRFDLPGSAAITRGRYGSGFPSAILSWSPTPLRQLKASYSRRISRPDPFQLNPLEMRQDARSVFRGNPSLRPEYTDAYELTLQDGRKWGSVQLTPYVRQTAHAVRFIRSVDTSGVTVATFANVAHTTATGADLNVTWRHGPLNVFGGGGAYDYRSEGGDFPGALQGASSTHAFSWNARANVSWKVGARTDLQLFANYRARTRTETGAQHAFVFSNVALRRKVLGEAGSVTLRVQDPFNLAAFGFDSQNGRVIESTERRFGMRGVFLSFTSHFGQQLKLRPRPADQEPQPPVPGPGGP